MIKELNHVGILTGNMDKSRQFYTEILGGTVIRDFINADNLSQFVYIQLALGVIELIRVPTDSANRGFAHVAFLIDDSKSIEENHSYLEGKGYEFTVAPKIAASGDGRLAFFKDDAGVILELIQRTEDVRIRDLVNPNITAFHHIAINASIEAAAKCEIFYTTDMGFTKTDSKMSSGGRKTLYKIQDDTVEVTEIGDAEALSHPLSHICLGVLDCFAMQKYLVANNMRCSDIIIEDDHHLFNCFAPDGEQIVFTDEAPR